MCGDLNKAVCDISIVVLRHILERPKNSNTGGLTCRALQGSMLVDYANLDAPVNFQELTSGDTWLLYPKPGAKVPESLPEKLIVVDGTWPQARRMVQRNPALHSLPCLALPEPKELLPRMRKGARPEQMSTAESIVAALRILGQGKAADHLEWALREMIRRISTHSGKE